MTSETSPAKNFTNDEFLSKVSVFLINDLSKLNKMIDAYEVQLFSLCRNTFVSYLSCSYSLLCCVESLSLKRDCGH